MHISDGAQEKSLKGFVAFAAFVSLSGMPSYARIHLNLWVGHDLL